MNLDKTLANLKKIHQTHTDTVARLTAEIQAASEELKEAQDNAAKTQEAIDALEGRGIKKALEDALAQQKSESLNSAVGTIDSTAAPSSVIPKDLPPPEAGFQWAQNDLQEWVLIPLNGIAANTETAVVPISLPPLDEEFADRPEDLI